MAKQIITAAVEEKRRKWGRKKMKEIEEKD